MRPAHRRADPPAATPGRARATRLQAIAMGQGIDAEAPGWLRVFEVYAGPEGTP